jgi:hypothetical protein
MRANGLGVTGGPVAAAGGGATPPPPLSGFAIRPKLNVDAVEAF